MSSKSDSIRTSRYVQGGDVTRKGNRLDWWERRIFPTSTSDVRVPITAKYAGRPDRLAYDLYGRAYLMWFILQYANIVDPEQEMVQGAYITLPTRHRLDTELLTHAPKVSPRST